MKTLYFMRHGQTLFNKRNIIQGWCDSPLTELGINQAKIAGRYFKENEIEIDKAYSSTSERASDTLEYAVNMPYERVKGLKEWNFGLFEGESEDLNPPLPYGDFFYDFGGEKELDFRKRVVDTVADLMERTDDEVILAVSHAASIAQFLLEWEHKGDIKWKDIRISNCAILKFEYENKEFKLVDVINHDFSELE